MALGSAGLVGLLNGLGVAYLRIPSLVMTLGMNAVSARLTLVYTNGSPQGNAPGFARELAVGRIGGAVPYALLFWLALGTALIALLRRSVFGRRLYAVGNNRQVAYLSRVPVRGVLVAAYTDSGCRLRECQDVLWCPRTFPSPTWRLATVGRAIQ